MWIKLNRNWMDTYKRGAILNLKEVQANLMIQRGTAVACQPPEEDNKERVTMKDKMKDRMKKKSPVQKA